ncbi:8-oxo-dGTP diphosphatase [compost metagenome]
MITLRMMSTALLMNPQNELLMMKRSMTRTLSPGLWAAVGGHLESYELNNPRAACLREIAEETGILEHEIDHLRMQYVLIRLNKSEIRQQFFYIGTTNHNPRISTDEGELHWIPRAEVLQRPMPFIFRSLLEHYWEHGDTSFPWVGTAGLMSDTSQPTLHWNPLLDPGLL